MNSTNLLEIRGRGRPRKPLIDFTNEIKEHKRCPKCLKPTNGIESYKAVKTKKITKTCDKCREQFSKYYKNQPKRVRKTLKMKDKSGLLESLLRGLQEDKFSKILKFIEVNNIDIDTVKLLSAYNEVNE
jgi:hypothetical protein